MFFNSKSNISSIESLDISKKYINEIITVSLFDEASMTTTFDYYENGEKIQTSIIEEE